MFPLLVLPQYLASLKHLRMYQGRMMEASEIAANAASGCFLPANTNAMSWYRFNLPQPGDPTTLAENSTEETQYNGVYPAHTLTTTYAYNSTNQVVKQHTPDGGTSAFWYDYLSRLVVSQNAKQLPGNNYSYTKYDSLGRITEVGEKNTAFSGLLDSVYLSTALYSGFLNSGSNSQITQTLYDLQPAAGNGIPSGLIQNNLRKRVAASIYHDLPASTNINATYYSYDQGGNVNTLWQQVDGLGLKKLAYEYDLVSGKVNLLSYQHGQNDQFYYQFKYDAENRLTEAWSSTQAAITAYGFGSQLTDPYRKLDASYEYYLHGPLARTELGDLGYKVQGTDYAYTLQGWLKGVNSTTLSSATDMGSDGSGLHQTIGKDVYGFSLGYYTGDYKPIGGASASAFGLQYQAQAGDGTGQALFNGNISNMTVALSKFRNGQPVGYSYKYDQLNRLKEMRQSELSTSSASWNNSTVTDKYKESYSYDGNGNILSLLRNGTTEGGKPLSMDNLNYGYNKDSQGKLINNKLRHVKDAVSSSNYTEDIDDQPNDNYSYDAIGNLIKDTKESITNIDWTVYGKIKSIAKSNEQNINFSYDATGNRVSKTSNGVTTYYVQDAQGNSLALYDNKNGTSNWLEQHLYGSSRLGMWKPNINLSNGNITASWDTIGKKSYELTNHLGNVLAVISDKRTLVNGNYEAEVISANDYYSFGSPMPNRTFSISGMAGYRYGFNGQEKIDEISGIGNHNTAQFWEYDTRTGRRWNLEPKKDPSLSDYAVFRNNPILFNDVLGDIPWPKITGSTKITSHLKPMRSVGGEAARPHQGLDIGAAYGSTFRAAAGGKVIATSGAGSFKDNPLNGKSAPNAKDGGGWGNYVVVDHGNGVVTIYAHMKEGSMSVKLGDKISDGQQIGEVGNSGHSYGAHAHVEAIFNEDGSNKFSGRQFKASGDSKSSHVFSLEKINDLQDVVNGKEKPTVDMLDGSKKTIDTQNSTKKENEK